MVVVGAVLIMFVYGELNTAVAGGLDEDNTAADGAQLGQQAIEQLLDSAADYVGQSEFDQAAAALERALRIEPANPEIWHLLGQVRLHQGQHQQAEAMAEKSNSLAGAGPDLQERNAQVIAVARQLASGRQIPVPQAPAAAQPERPQPESIESGPAQVADAEPAEVSEPITIPITRYTLEENSVTSSEQNQSLLNAADELPASRFAEQTVLLIAQPQIEADEGDLNFRQPDVSGREYRDEQQPLSDIADLQDRLRARADDIRERTYTHARPQWFDNHRRHYRRYDAEFDKDRDYHHRQRPKFRGKWHKQHKHGGKHRGARNAHADRW
jgi:tetratricopeptide (TPR) repeat protein